MAEYKQRSSCEGCRALKEENYCKLGFHMNSKTLVPEEPCPQPTSGNELYACEIVFVWRDI